MEPASVLLVSGGADSVTLLYQLVDSGEPVSALFIDYGQRAARQERAAAETHCEPLGVELVPLDLAAVGELFRDRQERKLHLPLPHRNLVALALAASFATNQHAPRVYLAANREDTASYASSSHAFLAQMKLVFGLIGPVQLATPFLDLPKADVIRRGCALGIDYATTYSCMLGYARHCGRCPQCRQRRSAFAAAGIAEEVGVYQS